MPVIILVGDSRTHLEELKTSLSARFSVVHLSGEFRTTRSRLSNLDPSTAYIVENCDMKPQRYEIYCLVKRNETSYCVLATAPISSARHDNPLFVARETLPTLNILECLESTLSCSVAHRKRIVGPNYLMQLKQAINRVNEEMPRGSEAVLRDCESRIMRMVQISPVQLDGLEDAYREIVQSALRDKGFR